MSGRPALRTLSRETLDRLVLPAKYEAAALMPEPDALILSVHTMRTSVLLFNSPKYMICVVFVEPESAVTRYYLEWGDETVRLPPPLISSLVRSYPKLKRAQVTVPLKEQCGTISAEVCRQVYSYTPVPERFSDVSMYVLWQAVLLRAAGHTSVTCFSDCAFQRFYTHKK